MKRNNNGIATVLSMLFLTGFASAAGAQGTKVATYRVGGWENNLVQSAPNLRNYYWEPQSRRVVLTTRTTGKQAELAAMPQRSVGHYKLAYDAPAPKSPSRGTENASFNSDRKQSFNSFPSAHPRSTTAIALTYASPTRSQQSSCSLQVTAKLTRK